MSFVPGWHPDFHAKALETMQARGTPLYQAKLRAGPIPRAVSLSSKMLRWLDQMNAGTCFVHGPIQAVETTGNALGLDVFPICRRHTGWLAKQIDDDGGNPADGGSGYSAFMAMLKTGGGIAHEKLCPYTDHRRVLAKRPPQWVFDDAQAHWLDSIVKVTNLDDAKYWLAHEHCVAIGSWWPNDWGESDAIKRKVGKGSYGHERCLIGYAEAGVIDEHEYFEEINSYGLIYDPLPPELAAKIPGYKPWTPDKSAGFWVQRECLEDITVGKDGGELATMTNLERFRDLVDVFADALMGY
jgi:hypothetical protein